jgi:hypothetical protein
VDGGGRSGRQWMAVDSASSFRLREATSGEPKGYIGPASAESGHNQWLSDG